jgi:hypothetical protein
MRRNERLELILLILVWSILPVLPAIWQGDIAGSPYTDLYPSIWSLWATEDWWGQWRTGWLNAPNGQDWFPSTLLLGTLIIPLKSIVSMGTLYNWILVLSRCIGCASFYLAGRAWGNTHQSGLLAMIVVAMAPMIQGFTVEGIIEGTQIWPLGFWLWSVHTSRPKSSVMFGCLIILSNWYWACIWGILQTLRILHRKSEVILLITPLVLTSPWWIGFLGQGHTDPIDPTILRRMGFQFSIPTPNWWTAPNPFAQSNYIGWALGIWSLILVPKGHHRTPLYIIGLGFVLSLGLPWMQHIPILSAIRFPYRLHLMTLIGMALWIGCNTQWQPRHRTWLWLILAEQLLASPIDSLVPSANSEYPEYVERINGTVLEIPGPLNRPPGMIDPSKPRAKYLFYHQTGHARSSAWQFAFNGLHSPSDCFSETRILDPHATELERSKIGPIECWDTVEWVVIHNRNTALDSRLIELGFVQETKTVPVLWKRP